MPQILDGDVFDENVLLDETDDVLDVSETSSSSNDSNNHSNPIKQDDELEEETNLLLSSSVAADDDSFLKDTSASPEKSIESAAADITDAPLQKKVVLKRKSTSLIESASAAAEQTKPTTTEIETGEPAKRSKIEPIVMDADASAANGSSVETNGKAVKWSELSQEELMEIRAKKFGAAPSSDTAKAARAERFGVTGEESKTETVTPKAAAAVATDAATADADKKASPSVKGLKITFNTDVDVLKKRAERFGGSVSTAMVQIENKEKLQKRQARFSGGTGSSPAVTAPADTEAEASAPAVSAPAVSTPAASDNDDRLKARLERFKTAV